MADVLPEITDRIRDFISEQSVFFVASAPLAAEGHVNLSPKGLDTFRVLGPDTVAYLDLTGSGNETAAHLAENGRITFGEIHRVQTSCGFGVPTMGPPAHRSQLVKWAERKGDDGLAEYRRENNTKSIDGIPVAVAE